MMDKHKYNNRFKDRITTRRKQQRNFDNKTKKIRYDTCEIIHRPKTEISSGSLPIERRNPGALDVEIEILFCGVCHTDIHYIRNDFGTSLYQNMGSCLISTFL
jgi:hypothetical protein